jgi:hypothetical protein
MYFVFLVFSLGTKIQKVLLNMVTQIRASQNIEKHVKNVPKKTQLLPKTIYERLLHPR